MFAKSSKSLPAVLAISLVLVAFAAPVAQAQSRDTGVGRIIAAQGNQALQRIKAELRETIKLLAPTLPSTPAAKNASKPVALAPVNGAAAAVRCAE